MVKTSDDENDGKSDVDLDRSDGKVESDEVGERARVTAFRTFSRTWHLSLRANSLSDSRIEIFVHHFSFLRPATCDRLMPSMPSMPAASASHQNFVHSTPFNAARSYCSHSGKKHAIPRLFRQENTVVLM